MKKLRRCVVTILLALVSFVPSTKIASRGSPLQSGEKIALVAEGELGDPGNFAAEELALTIRRQGAQVIRAPDLKKAEADAILVMGIPHRAVRLHDLEYSGKISLPLNPEAYTIRHLELDGRPALVVAASDERGLMYALLEIERRIARLGIRSGLGSSGTPSVARALATTTEENSKGDVQIRGVVQFLHSAELEREWYYDPEYWKAYLGMLARDRFNSFNLVFAHQTDYLAPPYPFLFALEKYPQVKVPGLSESDQKRNLATLQMISRLARQRGIDFIMGIWEHRAWKRGQQSSVAGLTDDILVDYARLAMEKLLRLCPDISGIQLRVNTESGIENEQQTEFYRDGVIAGMKTAARPVLLDLRGWGALPGTIEAAVRSGLPMRLSMKYWAEFMGMPYQAAQMLPSYSFADFLHYPRDYPVFYQVWSLGSHRLLPWGSVDWIKRFVATTHLGEGLGFETCAPLSQKGFGNPPGQWRIFASRDREYYRWEFERYWLYYLLYGRLSYNPSTSEDVWMDEFRARFGEKAAPAVFDAFQAASRVLPFLVSYRLSNPNMYIWPEKQMGGVLDFFIEVKPADEARVASFEEYVSRRLQGARSAKMTPEEASDRLQRMADDTERALSRADGLVKPSVNKEYAANRIDLTVLALLARFHAQKIRAGAHLALFYASGDELSLRTAQSHAVAGLETWQRLVRLTDSVYFSRMVFGPRDVGHWKDNLVFVRHDVERLREVQEIFDRYGIFDVGLDFGPKIIPRRSVYEPQYGNTYPVERRFHSLDPEMIYAPQRGFGWKEINGISASEPMRIPYTSLEGDNLQDLSLPSGVLYKDFLRGVQASTLLVDLPDGDYRVTSIVTNQPELAQGSFQIHARSSDPVHGGPGEKTMTISYGLADHGDKSMDLKVIGGRLALEFIPEAGKDWLVSGLVITNKVPHIAHIPVPSATAGLPLRISATVTVPEGQASVVLHYWLQGAVRAESVPMQAEGRQFVAQLTPSLQWEGKEIRYYIAARDQRNHETRLPLQGEYLLRIGHDSDPPLVEHKPVTSCVPGKPLPLAFEIRDASEIVTARLHYRHLTQMELFQTVDLRKTGAQFEATIPGEYIGTRYDLMYYVEVVDRFGNGAFYPNPDLTTPYVVVKVRR